MVLHKEVVDHIQEGGYVNFSLSPAPLSVSLQRLSAVTGRWVGLSARIRPPASLTRLRVPERWLDAQLRVVATYRARSTRRTIPSETSWETRSVSFISATDARLFSVESRHRRNSPWVRVSTVAATAEPKAITVPLPVSVPAGSQIRVIEVAGEPKSFPTLASRLPSALRRGPTAFGAKFAAVSGQPVAMHDLVQVTSMAAPSADSKQAVATAVEESDIWKIRGSKIYFFNRLRGLQVIETSNHAAPLLVGSLPMAGSGEEMYLLGTDPSDASAALLLTGSGDATRLSRIALAGGITPSLQSELPPLPGHYVESRLIGGLLHVVTSSSFTASGDWSPRTYVTTVDVTQNGTLVASPSLEFEFAVGAVGSTGKYFWLAAPQAGSWLAQTLLAFPLRSDGSLADPLQAQLGGVVQDKFKIGDTADGFAAVVQTWDPSNWQRVTSVETFREIGGALTAAGRVELVRNESLFATRFHADRLYVVTFEQVDPLWIVDLADPAEPKVKGHLEVPGWSTFIQPVGDVLLAVGRDGGKVQVSMFDVADPSNPTLAKRVDLGGNDGGWSWSEAEWNEKAVKILPESGLILLPVTDWAGGTRQDRVSLVEFDVEQRALVVRGSIDHGFAPRRAALMDNGLIASVSNRELLLVDITDRDAPMVSADLTLAFGVDRVVVNNGSAIMFENGGSEWSGSPRKAIMRFAPSEVVESVSAGLSLPCERVVAAEIFGDRLVVVEAPGQSDRFWRFASDLSQPGAGPANLSVWSLQDGLKPELIGRAALPFEVGSEVELLPVAEGRVSVVSRDQGWNHWVRPLPVISDLSPMVASSALRMGIPWFGWGGQSLRLAIAEIGGVAPSVVGSWELSGDGNTGISGVFSAGDLLAFSYDRREELPPGGLSADAGWTYSGTRSWLQIIDLAHPAEPMPWAPIQLPGELVGLSWLQRSGGIIFARSGERVAALGFDGENASVVAEVVSGPVLASQGSALYFPAADGVSEWAFSEKSATWTKGPGWKFEAGQGISSLLLADGALLAGNGRSVWVLREDGSVVAHELPAGARLDGAARSGDTFIVPAGEYGAAVLR